MPAFKTVPAMLQRVSGAAVKLSVQNVLQWSRISFIFIRGINYL
jgi:hypothetical protein